MLQLATLLFQWNNHISKTAVKIVLIFFKEFLKYFCSRDKGKNSSYKNRLWIISTTAGIPIEFALQTRMQPAALENHQKLNNVKTPILFTLQQTRLPKDKGNFLTSVKHAISSFH